MQDILSKKLAIDTNILIYLLDKKSSFHGKTVELFLKFEREKTKLVMAQQSLVELVQTLTVDYKKPLDIASATAKKIVESTIQIVSPMPQTVETYLRLCRSNKKAKNHFDLFLAATLIDNKVDRLLTNDKKGFRNIKQLKVVSLE